MPTDPVTILAAACLACAALPACVFLWNQAWFRPPRGSGGRLDERSAVSVLIPARNEAGGIGRCVRSVLASDGVRAEVVVLDDHSTDGTAAVVTGIAEDDGRVRLEAAPPLPAGWCGKQFACATLAGFASHDTLCFLDADVRLAPDALARMAAERRRTGVDLLSGFPRQETVTFWERAVLPLIHFVLLGFLPLNLMRGRQTPPWAAGCGQLFLTSRDAYDAVGGHAAVRASLHDGLTLPRAYRAAGRTSDAVDASSLAVCRMYKSAGEVWRGLRKNATEGIAAPGLLAFFTPVLGLGQVAPVPLLVAAAAGLLPTTDAAWACLCGAVFLSHLPRVIAAVRFGGSWVGAAAHPAGVAFFLAVQWAAFGRKLAGRPAGWRGREYSSAPVGRAVPDVRTVRGAKPSASGTARPTGTLRRRKPARRA